MCNMPGFYPQIVLLRTHQHPVINEGQVGVTACSVVRVTALTGVLLTEGGLVWVMDLIGIWSLEKTVWSICYILLEFWKVRSNFLQA